MMRFETEDVFDHSIYGYLFLKHMSPLSQWADIVLYHHFNYDQHTLFAGKHLMVADMIHLADRVDVMLQTKGRWPELDELYKHQGRRFAKRNIDLFLEVCAHHNLMQNLLNGFYMTELADFGADAEYPDETLLEFIRMIACSIDFRSETTVSHVTTTVTLSQEMGRLLRLDETEMNKIRLGAYLHDIGKISTPLEILEKPGSLTPEEMQVMRKHIDKTGEILRGRIDEDVLRIACRHHEKIDGSGYPARLAGEQLTLNERIVAVADVMSALAGVRSYKKSFSKETVIEILQQQKAAGKLCGRVIDTAVQFYDIIMESGRENIRMITEMYDCISTEFRQTKLRFEEIK
jgi:putative nucleotidyltransferase with HDIG domain